MSKTEKNTLEIRKILSELIGEVTAKGLFTGYGIFYGGDMFGLYQNNRFYLRAEQDFAKSLEEQGAVSYSDIAMSSKLNISNYYRLPASILQDKERYKAVLILSIQQIKSQKLANALAKKSRIKELPNLTIKHERLLAKINIRTVMGLKAVGAANCYVRLKKLGISVNITFFFNLTAALLNKNTILLSKEECKEAIETLNRTLRDAGLRPVVNSIDFIN
ncbi:TfoX/Sxy family DNA transformation protein [Seminibacterium arietis]|uniref:TfoX/Sxy family DNA transformation protein n=1 Tax=Seminibacterium arietis TaxID=1173502 RepID=A0ABW3IAF9_9PAST